MVKDIYISFDIDGTLVCFTEQINVHIKAFQEAFALLAKPVDDISKVIGEPIMGWMDKKIIMTILKNIGCDYSDEKVQEVMKKTEEIFVHNFTGVPIVPPGITKVLDYCVKCPNITIGLASGNLPGIAWKKIENAGLLQYFPEKIGGFGVVLDRCSAIKNSRLNAEQITGKKFDKIIHIGDTANDISSAHLAGAQAIAVLTGQQGQNYEEPCLILNNFEDGYEQFLSFLSQ